MNLVEDEWIPVRRKGGAGVVAPYQIVDSSDLVLEVMSLRPDFGGAVLQFLVGLLQTACPPKDQEEWAALLESPPSPARLRECLEPFRSAFELQSADGSFMQDFDSLTGESKPVANLLIDAPGANALSQNTDHFIKRGGVEWMCPSCVATALYCLQTNAPSGGVGHRTSLRGGGPLTTLVVLDPDGSQLPPTLWRSCWLNVIEKDAYHSLTGDVRLDSMEFTFPWLAHTRTSEAKTGHPTTPLDAHPMQMYWGMPRRIRVDWEHTHDGDCGLCGETSKNLVSRYVTQNYGVNYEGAWKHPLSPYAINKEGAALPQHAQPGGFSYRHWLGLTSTSKEGFPAEVVHRYVSTGKKLADEQFRLHVFGYDMDNMKARCWYESTFPLYTLDESIRTYFAARVAVMIQASTDAASMTRTCIKDAWFKRPGDARGDTSYLVEAFLSHTESEFFQLLNTLKQRLGKGADGSDCLREWHGVLTRAAISLFDYWTSRGDMAAANPRRIARAHRKLSNWLHGKKFKTTLYADAEQEKAA